MFKPAVAGANSVRLIQMLFDGLLESFSIARGHIERRDIQGRAEAIDRANRIILVCKPRWILKTAASWLKT